MVNSKEKLTMAISIESMEILVKTWLYLNNLRKLCIHFFKNIIVVTTLVFMSLSQYLKLFSISRTSIS